VAIDLVAQKKEKAGPNIALIAGVALFLLIGAGAGFFVTRSTPPVEAALTAEAKAYLGSLPLEDIEMTSAESFGGGRLIEIKGNITNGGSRPLKRAEVWCVFRDGVGQIVLRQRWPIVASGLKPGEKKPFRLPFDTVPESWNQQLPNVVVASIEFD
jgi:hypothetical protein